MFRLQLTDHEHRRRSLELQQGGRIRIGRSAQNDVVISDPSLSRKQVEVYETAGGCALIDCGSSNGTFVRGQKVDGEVRLEPGVEVRLGACKLVLEPLAGQPVTGPGGATVPGQSPATRAVRFADQPMSGQGTVVLSAADALGVARTPARDEKAFNAELNKVRERMRIVERANLELLVHEPVDALLPKVLDLVFEAVRPERAALLLRDENDELDCRAYRSTSPGEMSISRTIARNVMDEGVSVLAADAQADDRFLDGASIVAQGIQAIMAVPLRDQERIMGLIYADSRMSSGLFDDSDLRLLTMLANVAAIQIRNAKLFAEQLEKQRFEREAKAAAEIQGRLLPRSAPQIPGYAFIGHSTPCHECGGDYYDCLPLDDDRWAIVLADVAGKGMGAAMLMAVIQATLRARAGAGSTVEDLTRQLESSIARSAPSNRYATLFLLDLDRTSHQVRFVNGGHAPPPVVVRATGELVELSAGGPPVGLFPGTEYAIGQARLEVGDSVFACTDGVTDLEDAQEEMFGDERLTELLQSLAGRPAEQVHNAITETLGEFAGRARQTDDLTYVLLQRVE